MKDSFISLPKYGQLYMDKILFQAGYPVLFTCVNAARDLFVCVCCQNNEHGVKWLISRTKAAEIVKVLKNALTIREVFTNEPTERFSVTSFGDEIKIVQNDSDEWAEDSIFLPKANEYMDAEPEEFEEEIAYYGQYDLKYASANGETVFTVDILDTDCNIIPQDLFEETLKSMCIVDKLVVTCLNKVEEIFVESKRIHLKETQKLLLEYQRRFKPLKNREMVCAESSGQNVIFEVRNEMGDDWLIAA